MKKFRLFLLCLMVSLLGVSSFTLAEDIDIYSANADNFGVPNLMFVLDSSSNSDGSFGTCTYWDGTLPSMGAKTLGNEQCALANIVHALPKKSDGAALLNLGITTSDGLFFKLTPIDDNAYTGIYSVPAGTTNRQAFILAVKAMTKHTGSVVQGDQMQETWAYYTGGNGGTTGKGLMSGIDFLGTNMTTGCQKNFAIFLGSADNNSHAGDNGNGSASKTALNAAIDNTTSWTTAEKTALKATITSRIALPDKYISVSNAREWAQFMYRYDANNAGSGIQSIVTYTLSLGGANVDMKNFIKDMSNFGGGKGFNAASYAEMVDAILKVLNEVQAVNSVFSSASLPVSVNAQGTYLNQVFLGMFRPDASANPRWVGNLKQYQFILTGADPLTSDIKLGDSKGDLAISSAGTSFIQPGAVSFWTKDSAARPDGLVPGGFFKNDIYKPVGRDAYDSPDGELVERGGVAQQLRIANLNADFSAAAGGLTNPRRLYTYCPANANCAAALTSASNAFAIENTGIAPLAFAASTISASLPPDRNTIIKWVRGHDNATDELGPGGSVTVRPSIHGDVLHSRPVVVNYGDSRGLVVFYGANDGVFRAVNGSQTAALGSVPAGGELWGLVLPDHFKKLNRLRVNSPELKLPSTALRIAEPKDYFVDGSPGVYQKLKADGTVDKAYLFLTMRRGGRLIYAIDVSIPTEPKVMWKLNGDSGDLCKWVGSAWTCTADSYLSELGQTWSRPRVTLVKGSTNPVLVFGAGYDTAEDAEPPTANTMGRGIFVLDAVTGARVWSAAYTSGATACTGSSTQAACAVSGMNWAIPADISFVDRDNDGKTDRFYAADLGGNVWRVDLEPTAGNTPDKWQVNKLAALGCPSGSCSIGTTPRKFFFPPNVVPVGAAGASGSYDVVLLGSGDREHPLTSAATGSAYNVTNRFYALKDTFTGKDATGITAITETGGLFNASSLVYDGTLKGFYTTFAIGEKAVNASTTLRGTTFFGTNKPKPPDLDSCVSNLGQAKGYALDPFKGTSSFTVYQGGGLPPSPTTGIVTILLPDGTPVKKEFCIGCAVGGTGSGGNPPPPCNSALEACTPTKKVAPNLRRTYWYKK